MNSVAYRQKKVQALVLREAVEPTVAVHSTGLGTRCSERLGYAPTVTEWLTSVRSMHGGVTRGGHG
jgi:hypothetical protein